MTIRAQTADGAIHEFPDGTKPEVIDKAMATYAAQQKPGYQAAQAAYKRNYGGPAGDVTTALLNGLTFNNADRVEGGQAAAVAAARRFLGDKGAPDPGEAYAATRDAARDASAAYHKAKPGSSAGYELLGGLAYGGVGGRAIAAAPTVAGKIAGSAVVGAATGAAYGAGADKANPVRGATQGGYAGAALGAALPAVAQGARAIAGIRRVPGVDQALLAAHGVKLTPGQAMGGAARHLEDAATSTPILGDTIIADRQAGVRSFNRAVLNKALEPIGETLPQNVDAGTQAVRHVGDRISAAYKRAIPTGGVTVDPQLATDLAGLHQVDPAMTPSARQRLSDIVSETVDSRFSTGKLDGETYKRIQSDLGRVIAQQAKRGDPEGIGESLQHVSESLTGAARRQNPRFAAALDRADASWALLTRAERAAAGVGTEDGVFTPAQYANAVKAADSRVRGRGFARGEALGQELAGAAKRVMTSKTPDSGTARRVIVGNLLGAGGAVLGAGVHGQEGAVLGATGTMAGLGAAAGAYRGAGSAAQRWLARGAQPVAQATTRSVAAPISRIGAQTASTAIAQGQQ